MKFLLVKALAKSHCYSQFANALHEALLQIGQDAVLVDRPIGQAGELARELIASRYDVVLSFSSVFGDAVVSESGESLFDVVGVKFLGWQLDHPVYVHHALAPAMRNRHSIYSNRNHKRFAEAVGIGGRSATLLPGGRVFDAPLKDHASREWPVLVAATWTGAPERVWEAMPESPARRLFAGIVDRLCSDPEVSVLDAFNGAATHLGLGARLGVDRQFDSEIVNFLRGPLSYVRQCDRIEIVRSLVDAGLPVTLCGAGWRAYLGDPGNVTFLEAPVDFKDMPRLYNNAKITINLNAGNGASERALYSMMSGAAVVSDFSTDLSEAFRDGEEIAFFNRARPTEVADVVGDLLESGRSEVFARNGYARAMESALWRHRAEALAALMG